MGKLAPTAKVSKKKAFKARGVAKTLKRFPKIEGPHPVDMHVGARLRLRRMMLGISQETLGKALGLTFQQVQKYEKGSNRIGASRLMELSELLEVPIQFFYDDFSAAVGGAPGLAESGPGDDFMELLSSPEVVQLCRHFAVIKDPRVKKRVLELVKTIAEMDLTENG
jgi:transcriptional regulator with XRE-family HTH domain